MCSSGLIRSVKHRTTLSISSGFNPVFKVLKQFFISDCNFLKKLLLVFILSFVVYSAKISSSFEFLKYESGIPFLDFSFPITEPIGVIEFGFSFKYRK